MHPHEILPLRPITFEKIPIMNNEMVEPSQAFTFNAYKQLIEAHYDDACYDVRFVFSMDKEILAHRKLLSVLSTVFQAMFCGNWNENAASIGTVHITDASYNRFNEFLAYFYTNEVQVYKNNALDLVYLAKKYAVDDVAERCMAFMVDNMSGYYVLDWLSCALKYDATKLVTACLAFISSNTTFILDSEAFDRCDIDILAKILCLKTIQCTEGEMFDACIKWAAGKCQQKKLDGQNMKNIRHELGDCLRLLRVAEMDFTALCDRQTALQGLFATDELCTLQWQIFKNPANANRRQLTGSAACRPYTYSFPPNGLKVFSSNANHITFNVSKTLLLTGIQLPGIFVDTTSSGPQPLPFPCSAKFEIQCIDPATPLAYRQRRTRFLEFGPSAYCSKETAFLELPTKEVIKRNLNYEIKVVVEQAQFKGVVSMAAFHAKDRICRGIRFHTDHGNEPIFVGGFRFEEIGIDNLEHYKCAND